MPGPAPKDPAARRRRNSTGAQKTLLPAGGRDGKTPTWPIKAVPKPTTLWTSLWKLPQAVAWERQHLARVVARYAMLLQLAESYEASAAVLGEVRQLEDRLGLNPKAMRSLLWEVTEDEVGEKRSEAATISAADAARSRLRVV